MGRFRHAVALDHRAAESFLQRTHDLRRQRGGRGADEAEAGCLDRGPVTAGARQNRLMHGGYGAVPARRSLLHPGEEPQRVEARRAPDRAAGRQARQNRADQAVDVEKRHDVQTPVGRRQLQGLHDIPGRSADIALGQRHDFRARGRSRGVQDERDIVRAGCSGVRRSASVVSGQGKRHRPGRRYPATVR